MFFRYDDKVGEYVFYDCSPESPVGRRSICNCRVALDSKKNKPSGNAIEMAESIGIEILTNQQFRKLQALGEFDKKTSSWVKNHPVSENWALHCSVIDAMTMFLFITMVLKC